MNAQMAADIHPIDILLLWAASENDTPKVAELLRSGADTTAKARMLHRAAAKKLSVSSPKGRGHYGLD